MPYTVAINGVTAGPIGPIVLESVGGVGQTSRKTRQPRIGGGQVASGADVAEGRQLTFEMSIVDTSPAVVEALMNTVVAAWSPQAVDDELTLTMSGSDRVYRGRPDSVDLDLSLLPKGAVRVRTVFELLDAAWYSLTVKTAFVTIPISGIDGVIVATGGVTVAAGGVTVAGGGAASDAAALNAGTAPASWTAFLVGPLTNPRLTVAGKTIILAPLDLPAGSTLTVSSRDRSVMQSGIARQGVIAPGSRWADLPPGVPVQVSLRGDGGSGTATFSWQDASY